MAQDVTRRALLERGSTLALGWLLAGAGGLHAEELVPEPVGAQDAPALPVNVAVIGLGERGREILTTLAYVPGAVVQSVCDTYVPAHKKALELAPKASAATDYRQVLSDKTIQAVWVATPTHLHRQIATEALAAGKHVYCEAPLAASIDEARAIAQAGKAATGLIFHAGLQSRTNPQHHHVLKFVETGVLGQSLARCQAQYNRKNSWRRAAPTGEREKALNWRLEKENSGGLMGEIGIHQVDVASWFLKSPPLSVVGYGGIHLWKDGREVPDTVSCLFEYPGGLRLTYDATLANSFGANFELLQGSDAAVLLRDQRAWMFKEADATALGWEVYAKKDKVGDETGIMLVADASKLLALGKQPGDYTAVDPKRSALYFACEAFLNAIRTGKPTASGPAEGFAATVVGLQANEAVRTGTKIALAKEMFTL